MNRRTFLTVLTGLGLMPAFAFGMGEDDLFRIGVLDYTGGQANPRPTSVRRLLLEVEKQTSVQVSPQPVLVSPTSIDLFQYPFLMWMGDQRFPEFSEEAILLLRRYIQAGGFIVVDSAEGILDGPFMTSVKRELNRILPNKSLARIPRDHVIYKSFFLIEKPVGRLAIDEHLTGIFEDDRVSVVLTNNDLAGAWARDNFGNWTYPVTPGGDHQRTRAMRLGINLVMYALCINYKADQVHIPFILKRRRWRVE